MAGLPARESAAGEHLSLAAVFPWQQDFPSVELQKWAEHSTAVVTVVAVGV